MMGSGLLASSLKYSITIYCSNIRGFHLKPGERRRGLMPFIMGKNNTIIFMLGNKNPYVRANIGEKKCMISKIFSEGIGP